MGLLRSFVASTRNAELSAHDVHVEPRAGRFKSHPDDVARYIAPGECQLSYNPTLMALLWEALATRQVRLLQHSMQGRFKINPGCAWVNYVRCHDDIGLARLVAIARGEDP